MEPLLMRSSRSRPGRGKALRHKPKTKNNLISLSSNSASPHWPLASPSNSTAEPSEGIPKIKYILSMNASQDFMPKSNTKTMSTTSGIWEAAVALSSESRKKPDSFMYFPFNSGNHRLNGLQPVPGHHEQA